MLVTIGINHKTAALNLREQLAFSPEKVASALDSLVSKTALNEAAVLSTCNRTEIYGGVPENRFNVEELLCWWKNFVPKDVGQLIKPICYQLSDDKVVSHLMRLASGLDSLALGETQILGQLKKTYQQSKALGLLQHTLGQTFEASFLVAKKVRTQTEITKHPISVAYLAILLAKQIFTNVSKARVLLIGAGENIKQIIVHLKAQHVEQITIVNRTYEKAAYLAKHCQLRVNDFKNLQEEIAQADIIVSSTGSTLPLIDKAIVVDAMKQQKHRPLLMIDLGVPRDINPNVREHDDVYLYSVDDLQTISDENKCAREQAALQAEQIITSETCNFLAKLKLRNHLQVIKSMREGADNFKQKALARAKKELEQGVGAQQVIEKLAHALTNQLIHEPTIRVKEVLMTQDESMLSIYKDVFGIK